MSDRREAEKAAAEWIARRDQGPWSERDAAALSDWLAESAGHRAAYYRLNGAWQEAGRLKALMNGGAGVGIAVSEYSTLPGENTEGDSLQQPETLPASDSVRRFRYIATAAAVLLTVGAAFFLSSVDLFHRDDYSTVIGGLQTVPMPDGSRITLNTHSEIRVTVTKDERRVELKHGEAFFEVAKDPQRPFVVAVDDQRIVAVGTAFSVRRQDEGVRVIVSEGKVRVEVPGKDATLMEPLSAGSVVRTSSSEVLVQTKPIDEIEQSLSWRSGLLTFRDTPLADAVAEFNRYNARQIVIEDPRIAAIEIGGVFRATNLDSFVQLLDDGFPVQVTVEEERIFLRSR